jgi:hypothetical protein
MIQTIWQRLPFPYTELAEPVALRPLDTPTMLERMLEDCSGLAGVIASAAAYPECYEEDMHYATRFLAEHLHAAVVLWREWRGMREELDAAAAAPPPEHAQGCPRARRGTARECTPRLAGKEGEA